MDVCMKMHGPKDELAANHFFFSSIPKYRDGMNLFLKFRLTTANPKIGSRKVTFQYYFLQNRGF